MTRLVTATTTTTMSSPYFRIPLKASAKRYGVGNNSTGTAHDSSNDRFSMATDVNSIYDLKQPFVISKKTHDSVGWTNVQKVDPRTGNTYTRHFDENVEIKQHDVDTIDSRRASRISKEESTYEDPYAERKLLAFDYQPDEIDQFKRTIQERFIPSANKNNALMDDDMDSDDDDDHHHHTTTTHDKSDLGPSIPLRLQSRSTATGSSITTTVPSAAKSLKKSTTPNTVATSNVVDKDIIVLPASGGGGGEDASLESMFSGGSSNVKEDPLALFGDSALRYVLMNHIYIREVLIHLLPEANVPMVKREYVRYQFMFSLLSRAGLVLDVPSFEDKLGFDTSDVDDVSFTFNESINCIVLSFRFIEDVKAAMSSSSETPKQEETLSLKDATEEELTALIEDRIYTKVVVVVHKDDAPIVSRHIKTRIFKDDSKVNTLKERRRKRDEALKNCRVIFGFFFFVLR